MTTVVQWVNNRFSDKIADKGIMLKVYDDASHLGTSDVGQENFNNCEVYGFLDYLVYDASNDCKYWFKFGVEQKMFIFLFMDLSYYVD